MPPFWRGLEFLALGKTGSLLDSWSHSWKGHPPCQTELGLANGLKVQSHRPEGWRDRWLWRKSYRVETTRKYLAMVLFRVPGPIFDRFRFAFGCAQWRRADELTGWTVRKRRRRVKNLFVA